MQLGKTTVKVNLVFEARESENVIGMLEGTSLKDEYVVYSAPYDHLGEKVLTLKRRCYDPAQFSLTRPMACCSTP